MSQSCVIQLTHLPYANFSFSRRETGQAPSNEASFSLFTFHFSLLSPSLRKEAPLNNQNKISKTKRLLYIAGGAIGLFLVYFFQDYLDFYSVFFEFSAPEKLNYGVAYIDTDTMPFAVNKAGRYVLNDLFSISIIYGIFAQKKYARFAFMVMMFGLFVLLPVYLFLYLAQPAGFTSMISHLHRVVMNPVLMMLLIPAFYFQNKASITK
jgi:exosortase F-associated protein